MAFQASDTKKIRISAEYVSYINTIISIGTLIFPLTITFILGDKSTFIMKSPEYQKWSLTAVTSLDFPQRSFYQLLSAVSIGPKAIQIILWYYLNKELSNVQARLVLSVGLMRFISSLMFTYVTPADDEYTYDINRTVYLLLSFIWFWLIDSYEVLALQDTKIGISGRITSVQHRRIISILFLIVSIFAFHYYTQYRVYRVFTALGKCHISEWMLVILDTIYESYSSVDFGKLRIDVLFPFVNEKKSIMYLA